MMRRLVWTIIILLCCEWIAAQEDYLLNHIIEEVYVSAVEDGLELDFEQLQEDLLHLNEHKINLNQTNADELSQLYFLSERVIDNILVYRDETGFQSIYELQFIPGIKEWEYRYLEAFVYAGEPEAEKVYARELLQRAKHEILLRTDARNIENYDGDPMYISLKYKAESMQKLSFGLVVERDAGEPFWGHKIYGMDHIGGCLEIKNIGHLKSFVLGDYRAQFGLGLVSGSAMRFGKSSYVQSMHFGSSGLKKYSGTNEYNFLRGTGVGLQWNNLQVHAWYSFKGVDANVQDGVMTSIIQTGYHRTETEIERKKAAWEQIIGANVQYEWKQLRLGITAQEHLLSDTLRPTPNYYNGHYFSGKRQAGIGAYAMYQKGRYNLFGEVATAQNECWGIGALAGSKIRLTEDAELAIIGRYYSPWYDQLTANAFGETSRNNDESGLYIGTEVTRIKDWRLGGYADVFYFSGPKYGIRQEGSIGCEMQADAEWSKRAWRVVMRGKWKRKGVDDKVQGRVQMEWSQGGWRLRSEVNGNWFWSGTEAPTLGGVMAQDVEYRFARVPIVLQARGELFHTQAWNNRIYLYENDVLYAFSIPAIYGQGGRWYMNMRYKINERVAVYLKAGQTIYSAAWVEQQKLSSFTKTDIHAMVKVKL